MTVQVVESVQYESDSKGAGCCLIEVDGGIDTVTQAVCKENGVEVMVTGSAYFKAPNRAEFVRTIPK